MAKATFNNKNTLFTRKLDLDVRKKLEKCYIWSITLCGAETWKVDQEFLKIFEMWCWRKIQISWTDLVKMKMYYVESRRKGISHVH